MARPKNTSHQTRQLLTKMLEQPRAWHYGYELWAAGCVRASYTERYFSRVRYFLAAAVVGVAYEFLDETITGIMAAQAWPRWYIAFAKVHKHLSLELWSISAYILPRALVAAGFGVLLGRLAPRASITLPCLSLGVWVLYSLGAEVYSFAAICNCPTLTLWESWIRSPALGVAAVIVPAGAMLLAFHRAQRMTCH
ncbi:MAG TPA: hypothetical protein VIY90_05435 [Steroidobacteraceae bacterium]